MMNKKLFIPLMAALFLLSCSGTREKAEILPLSYYRSLKDESILSGMRSPLDEEAFRSACWAMAISTYRSEYIQERFAALFPSLTEYGTLTQRAFWEAVYTLYPREFTAEAYKYLREASNPKLFAMASYYLLRAEPGKKSAEFVLRMMQKQFPNDKYIHNPILLSLRRCCTVFQELPPLRDLLDYHPGNGCTIYVFFRKNRDYPGIALLRKEDGQWMRKNGRIMTTRILGRSMSGLPGTITNGNTPRGIYTLLGTGRSNNIFIGPSPTIITGLPFEYDKATFLRNDDSTSWEFSDYQALLPDSWKNFTPIHEAWYAGKAGRSEIIMHGSTILPELYKDRPYYPLTPSLGCMTHYEKWNGFGRLIKSDQQKMTDALMSCNTQQGFLVVVELDDKKKAVKRKDVIRYLK
ncbi:MAG: hypothetical protein U5N56_08495 [Candidatus Marinimicrobia bacterium]|nr:hypothetical protein [Candidatus Neomarinimicrobiota bacterium]